MKKSWSLLFSVSCCALSNSLVSKPALAQVSADGTTNTTVSGDGNGNFTIEQGDRAGNNLFHSFGDFSVPTDGSAFFDNAPDVSNIFSRVTGGNISNIDGLIQANGSANLFLINPAGILFGNNARLDIGGSFLGTTADSIVFEDGVFSATDFDNPPLLTVNAPIGLNFRDNPGDIVNTSVSQNPDGETNVTGGAVGLQAANGRSLALIGGDVLLDDGNLTAKGGQIEIGSVLNKGQIGISETDLGFAFNYDSISSFGTIDILNTSVVDVTASGGGKINLNANNIVIDNSRLSAGIFPGLGTVEAQAGDITLNAIDSITVTQNSRVNNNVGEFDNTAIGNSGNIFIESQNLILEDGSAISTSTFGQGNSGNLLIKATELVALSGESNFPGGLFAQVDTAAEGNAGNLTIETQKLSVSDGSRITASTFGNGNAGNLTIRASDIEVFETPTKNFFRTGIFASSFNAQRPGSLDFVAISQGNAGNLTIETDRLSLQDGGQVSVATNGVGNAGTLTVKATDSIKVIGIEDPDIFEGSLQNISTISAANEGGNGNGGNLILETKSLEVADGGQVSVATAGIGDAGNLNIIATDSISLNGTNSGIFAEVDSEAEGTGGNIIIQTGNLSLSNNAQLSAETPFGLGGNITLNLDDTLVLIDNSLISAQAFNNANGGNININTNFIIAFPNEIPGDGSDIIASAVDGDGGNISITAESLLGISEGKAIDRNGTNDIDASSDFGLDGTISIFTPDINLIQGAIELPSNVVTPDQAVAQACSNNLRTASNFVINGKGGIPPIPDAPMNSEMITINGATTANSSQGYAISTGIGDIIPARGVIKRPDGSIVLTATPVKGNGSRLPNSSLNCS